MKRHSLFKVMGIMLLLLVVLSYIIPGRAGEVTYLPFGDIVTYYIQTYYYFFDTLVFILVVGAFYGVLKVTGAYDKIMNSFMKFASGKEQTLLIAIMIIMALLSSFAGLDLGFLVVIPFLIGFIVKVGYNKLVALSATVGSIIIGMYGATFAGTLYGYNNEILSLKATDQLLFKVILSIF